MSLPLIADTAAEVHRLAIAGSALAAGDFRLNKLVPQLEALGAKAPIFTRIAQGVKAVTEDPDAAKAGRALLDLSTLLTAIQYTQSPHGADGEFTPISTGVQSWTPTVAGYRSHAAVVEALTSTGEGRLEIVKDACERGLFKDLRLMQPAVGALRDRYGELADYVADHAIPQLGPSAVPLLRAAFDPSAGNANARWLRAICSVDAKAGRDFCRSVFPDARKDVRLAAIRGMTGSAQDLDLLISLISDRTEDVRVAAVSALRGLDDPRAVNVAREILAGEADENAPLALAAASVIAACGDHSVSLEVLDAIEAILPALHQEHRRIPGLFRRISGNRSEVVRDRLLGWFQQVLAGLFPIAREHAARLEHTANADFLVRTAEELLLMEDEVADRVLVEARNSGIQSLTLISLAAASRFMDGESIFDSFSPAFLNNPLASTPRQYLATGNRWGRIPEFPRRLISPRWTSVFMETGHPEEVAIIAQPGQAEAVDYLKSAEVVSRYGGFRGTVEFAEQIARIDAPGSIDYLFERLVELQKARLPFVWHADPLWKALASLPASSLPHFEQVSAVIQSKWKEEFDKAFLEVQMRAVGQRAANL